MLKTMLMTMLAGGIFMLASTSEAQMPGGNQQGKGQGGQNNQADAIINQLMRMDFNNDGKLSKYEVTDQRLMQVFDQIDTSRDGFIAREELTQFFQQMNQQQGGQGQQNQQNQQGQQKGQQGGGQGKGGMGMGMGGGQGKGGMGMGMGGGGQGKGGMGMGGGQGKGGGGQGKGGGGGGHGKGGGGGRGKGG